MKKQLDLNFLSDGNDIRACIEEAMGQPVVLTITDNVTSIISVRIREGIVRVRLHRIFLDAGPEVIREVAWFVRTRRGRTILIAQFIRENSQRLRKREPRRQRMRSAGRHYNLQEIFKTINGNWFEGRISAAITWGRRGPCQAVRKMTLGSYNSRMNTIRLHPLLDQDRVPRYVVETVMYHEMLHADMGIRTVNGRRRLHPPEFRAKERLFPHYDRTKAWEKRQALRGADKVDLQGNSQEPFFTSRP